MNHSTQIEDDFEKFSKLLKTVAYVFILMTLFLSMKLLLCNIANFRPTQDEVWCPLGEVIGVNIDYVAADGLG